MRRMSRRYAKGFTFVETLVSIIVLALVMAAAAPLAQAAVRSLSTLAREEVRLHAIARAYDAFRSSCEDTLVPPWIPSSEAVAAVGGAGGFAGGAGGPGSAAGYRVAYLGGGEDDEWTLSAGPGGLVVATPRGSFEVASARAHVEVIESGGRAIGLAASFDSMGRTWTWKGYFGAAGY